MREKFAILLTAILVALFSATACGGVQQQVEDRAREEVEKKVQGLPTEEIRSVRNYEKGHKNRKTLIESLDRSL